MSNEITTVKAITPGRFANIVNMWIITSIIIAITLTVAMILKRNGSAEELLILGGIVTGSNILTLWGWAKIRKDMTGKPDAVHASLLKLFTPVDDVNDYKGGARKVAYILLWISTVAVCVGLATVFRDFRMIVTVSYVLAMIFFLWEQFAGMLKDVDNSTQV